MLEDVFTCKQEAKNVWRWLYDIPFRKVKMVCPCYFLRFRKSWNFLKITHLKINFFLKIFIESPFFPKCSRSLHFTIEWRLEEISSKRSYLWREGKYIPQTRTLLSAKAYVLLMLIKVKMYLMRRCFKYKETYFCHTSRPLF